MIKLDIRKIETFIEVVECKNFSKAAEKLYLTQPTVSAHIHSLEKEINTQLIKRTTKEFEITEAGKRFYKYGINILKIRNKILEDFVDDKKKNLKLGASSGITFGDLPEIIYRFNKENPKIKFEIISSDSMDIIDKVQDGTVEVGLVGTKIELQNLKYTKFTQDNLVLVAPKNKYYTELFKKKITKEILLNEPFLVREKDSATKLETKSFLRQFDINMEDLYIVASMNNPISILETVKRGMGLTLISNKILKIYKDESNLLTVPIERKSNTRDFYIVTLKENYLSSLSIEFVEFLKNMYFIDL